MTIIGTILLLVGLILATVGLVGLLRKPDIFHQLHAAGLVTGPAVLLVLLASIATGRAEIITSAFLVIAFVLVTSSLSTHAIARAAFRAAPRSQPAVTRANDGAEAGRAHDVPEPGPMRVLIAHDGSNGADRASILAAVLAWPPGTALRLVGVLEADVAPFTSRPAAPPWPGPSFDSILDAASVVFHDAGATVDSKVLRGNPAQAIADEAASFGADLIITGTRGRTFLSALLVGSVAGDVVDRAPCPVLVARSTVLHGALLAIDGTPASAAAEAVVAGWPMFRGSRVTVLHVANDSSQPVGQSIADAAMSRLLAADVDAVAAIRGGDPASAIVDLADQQSVDLIVLGSRGRSGLKRTVLGSVAQAVLYSTSSSVLIVRAPPASGDADAST